MIYLDNAATTFPKPAAVYSEAYRCMTTYCGNPGRGGHTMSIAAAKKVFECRCEAGEMFGVDDPSRIVFTPNTTYAINLVLKGLLKEGDHVIISDMEHNSVYRPVHRMALDGKIEYSIFPTMTLDGRRNPARICAGIAKLVRPNTKLVMCAHSSNICSQTLPIKDIGAFCRRHGILFAVDAAQSAGHMPINMEQMNIDALCVPGHKGLYGPQGCGFAALGNKILPDTLTEGGNGVNSLDPTMPDYPPERYEAGTVATPAIAGLCEGIRAVRALGEEAIHEHEKSLYRESAEMLGNTPGVTLYAPEYAGSTLLFNVDGFSAEETSRYLDSCGICVRGGYHCCALGHSTLGTPDGGAVRVSFGIFNKKFNCYALCKALSQMSRP